MPNYRFNEGSRILIDDDEIVNNEILSRALAATNDSLVQFSEVATRNRISLFDILGVRNVSGFVGEVFSYELMNNSNNKLVKCPHQDGYPDLLLVNTEERRANYTRLTYEQDGKRYATVKRDFTPYAHGGIEIKATCGDTPSSGRQRKPQLGEQRIERLKSFTWKAHHTQTDKLMGILWDFIARVPTVTACFYSDCLVANDWNFAAPRVGGGRTTSVSAMKPIGVNKMCAGWMAVVDIPEYIAWLSTERWIGHQLRTE